MPRQQRQPPHREQAHLMPREAYRREVIDPKGRGAPQERGRTPAEMDRRTENRWSNEINDELDKFANSQRTSRRPTKASWTASARSSTRSRA